MNWNTIYWVGVIAVYIIGVWQGFTVWKDLRVTTGTGKRLSTILWFILVVALMTVIVGFLSWLAVLAFFIDYSHNDKPEKENA
jgi:hypothetical protein